MTLWHVPVKALHAQSRQQYHCVNDPSCYLGAKKQVKQTGVGPPDLRSRRLSRLLSRLVQGGLRISLCGMSRSELCVDRAADSTGV